VLVLVSGLRALGDGRICWHWADLLGELVFVV